MVWVDQPAGQHLLLRILNCIENALGTGFSIGGSYDADEKEVGEDMYHFMQTFFTHFPDYNKDVHVVGESYGGHYVPAVVNTVVEHNTKLAIGEGETLGLRSYLYTWSRFSTKWTNTD